MTGFSGIPNYPNGVVGDVAFSGEGKEWVPGFFDLNVSFRTFSLLNEREGATPLQTSRFVKKTIEILKYHLLSCFLFLATMTWSQGAYDGYLKGKGKADVVLTYAQENYDTYFFGRERQAIDNRIVTGALFAQAGVSDNLDVLVNLPYVRTDSMNQNFQDALLGIKYRNKQKAIENGSHNILTALGVQFPVSGYAADSDNPIGQRAVVFQARFISQHQWNTGFFMMMQSGLDFRLLPDAQFGLPVIARMGYGNPYFYFDIWVDYFRTLNAGVDTQIGAGQGSAWWKLGATAFIPLVKQFGIVGGIGQIVAGENIGLSTRWNAGFVWRLGWN
jgi:hypothetical protein